MPSIGPDASYSELCSTTACSPVAGSQRVTCSGHSSTTCSRPCGQRAICFGEVRLCTTIFSAPSGPSSMRRTKAQLAPTEAGLFAMQPFPS